MEAGARKTVADLRTTEWCEEAREMRFKSEASNRKRWERDAETRLADVSESITIAVCLDLLRSAPQDLDNYASMEHIPQPANPFQPIRTPLHNGPTYDNLGFSGFPERVGWNAQTVADRGLFYGYDQDGAPGFLQEWFWFGMLTECFGACGVRVKREDFLREEMGLDGERSMVFVTTAKFYAYAERFKGAASQMSEMAGVEASKKIDACLGEVAEYLIYHESVEERASKPHPEEEILENPLTSDIRLSVEALRTSLQSLTLSCLPELLSLRMVDVGCRFLVDRVVDLGMCPRMALSIQRNCGSLAVYYASLLGSQTKVGEEHDECRRGNCSASDIMAGEVYHQSHTPGCDLHCGVFGPNQELVGMIIDEGRIPLVYFEWGDTGDVCDSGVCRYESGQNFTAVSHVWSDGLGSPYENTTPTCRVNELCELIFVIPNPTQTMTRKLYLWLDTLCVPVQPSIRRNAAIQTIPTVFRAATRVLVLDSSLSRLPRPQTAVEALMRVLFSKWHHRLWTFQEGALAFTRLWFVFADSVVPFQLLLRELYSPDFTPVEYHNDIHAAVTGLCVTYSLLTLRTSQLGVLHMAVEGAKTSSTSKSSDETLCLASLLSLDVGAIMETPSNRRMRTLFLIIKRVPKEIIFLSGLKLHDPGFRWAPTSFLVDRSKEEVAALIGVGPRDFASVTERGLLGSFGGLRLERTEKRISHTFRLYVTSLNQLYDVHLRKDLEHMLPAKGLSIILLYSIEELGAATRVPAVLLGECEEEGGVVAGRYVCLAILELQEMGKGSRRERADYWSVAWDNPRVHIYGVDSKIYARYTTAKVTHPDQQWLIT